MHIIKAPFLPCLVCLLLPFSGAWGNCWSTSVVLYRVYGQCEWELNSSKCNSGRPNYKDCATSASIETCEPVRKNGSYYYFSPTKESPVTEGTCTNADDIEGENYLFGCRYHMYCNDSTEADSAVCVSGGGTWNGTSCGDVCEAEKAECDKYNGVWQSGNISDGSCNGNCNICGGDRYKESIKSLRTSCCESGWGVNDLEPCYNVQPPWVGYNQSGFLTAWTACNYGKQAQFDSWCLENAGDDTTQTSSSSQTPNCFGAGCPSSSSASESSSSESGGTPGGSSSSSDGEGGESSGSGEPGESSSSGEGGDGGETGESSGSAESSQSGGGQGGNGNDTTYIGNGEDWEYNYYPELDSLIKYLKGVFGISLQLESKIDDATQTVADKIVQWEPKTLDSILDALGGIKTALGLLGSSSGSDSTGEGWNGDSAIGALWDSISGMADTAGWGATFGYPDGDSALDSLNRFLAQYDSGFGITSGTVDSLGKELGDQIAGLADSGAVKAFNDSLDNIVGLFNFKRFSGSGGCPAFLTQKTSITFGKGGAVNIDGVGKYLCTTEIKMFGKTPWEVGRSLIRSIVALSCMFWLFKVATGAKGGDDD